MRQFVFAAAAVLAMSSTSFGLVTLDCVRNPDPAVGLRSYTVTATAVGDAFNTLGRFVITGDVYQVWTAAGVQSEWINDPDGKTPGNPKDSYVIFGEVRMPSWPSGGPVYTTETIYSGGIEGLGTLNNGVASIDPYDAYLYLGATTQQADLLHLVIPAGQTVTVELSIYAPYTEYSFFGDKALLVPEPATLVLLVLGLACLACKRLR